MAKQPERNQDKIDALYQWLSYELQQARDQLLSEVRMASAQIGSLYGELKNENEKASKAVSQEIRYSYKQNQTIYDGLASMLTNEVGERLNSVDEKLSALSELEEVLKSIEEIKENHRQLTAICTTIADTVNPKLDDIAEKQALLSQIEETLNDVNAKLEDQSKIAETVQSIVAAHNAEVLNAVASIPMGENVDYTRIVEEVGDKLLEILNQVKDDEDSIPMATVVDSKPEIDYDRIICGAAEKVVESLPYPEKVDYSRIENAIAALDMTALAETVASKIAVPAAPEVDYDRLADLVAAKIAVPAAPEVDYDRLADIVVAKMTANTEQTCEVVLDDAGIEEIAEKVVNKLPAPEVIDYDKVCQAAQAAQILPDPVDYDRIAEIVEDKIASEDATYDLVIDDEGINAIAKGVSEEICQMCAACEVECEELVEEVAPVEEPVVEEPAVEEVAPVEESVEEPVVEEPVVEEVAPVEEELATAAVPMFDESGNELVDAETGLVIRLKRSFTAKMKQSEEKIKGYYSDIKNELTSYKKINSNVSWHGDRFNYGRDTIAKININGKTLCFYVALDPNDPELKTTVYHQKDVGAQKAYENTPFMVKVKSDVAAKKALRLVGILAEKIGAEKEAGFEAVDYVEEFAYESTKQLFDEGFIKATKEKKVNFDF